MPGRDGLRNPPPSSTPRTGAFTASYPRYSRAAPRGSFTAQEEEDPHGCGGYWNREEEGKSYSPGAHHQSGGTESCSDQPHRGLLWWRHQEVAVIEVVQEEEEYYSTPTAKNTNRRTNTEGVGGHRNRPVYTTTDKTIQPYSRQHGIRHRRQPEHRQRGHSPEQLLHTCEQSASNMADPASTEDTPDVSPKDTSSTKIPQTDRGSPTRLLSPDDEGSPARLPSPDGGSSTKPLLLNTNVSISYNLSPDRGSPAKSLLPDAGSSTKPLSPDAGSSTRLLSSTSDNYSESEDVFPESDADVEERLARFRELKARLGSPAESVGAESVASGQFDDVDTESLSGVGAGGTPPTAAAGAGRGTRSRTVSSGSDQLPPVHTPLQDLVIPLPDSSDVMWARYASSDNLRDSPIALPDATGFFSPPPCREDCPVPTTTGTGAHSYSDQSAAHLLNRTSERASSERLSAFSPAGMSADKDGGRTGVGSTAPGNVGMGTGRAYPSSPLSREPYTPGSYLANRDKYYGASSAASSATSETSEYKSYFCSSDSERREGSGGKKAYGMDASTADDAASILRNVARTEPTAADLLNLNNKRETASTMYASSSDLRESLLRESLNKESTVRDSQARDSLVREVLAREAMEKDMKTRPPDVRRMESGELEQQVPVDVVLDKGRLSAIRDALDTDFSTGGYSLRDYKNYVAKNYGRDEAARIRDRTPQPFTPTPASYNVATGLGREEGPSYQPYYVSEDAQSISSDRDQDYLGSRRGDWDRSYVTRGDTGANQSTSRGYTSRGYDQQPRRAESMTSDRSYGSSAYSSAAPRTSDNESSSSGEQYASRSSSQAGQQGGQRQYQRSYSGDSARSASYRRQHQQQQQQDREEEDGSRTRRRRSLFDRPSSSLFNRDGIMELLDDLFDNKPDKRDLWQRHSGLLRDDDFCRDFFTRDWDWPSSSLFGEDDFFKDRGKNRRSKSKRTETTEEMREAGDGSGLSGHVRRVRRTQSMESDLSGAADTAEPASSRQGAAGGRGSSSQSSSSSSQSSSQHQHQQYRNGAARDAHPAPGSRGDAKYKASSFGSFNEEEEARFKERGEGRQEPTRGPGRGEYTAQGHDEGRGESTARGHARGDGRGEHATRGNGRGEGRGERNNGRGEGRKEENDDFWDKDSLFFRDYDDLIHRFKDLKWKSAMESYKSNEEGKAKDKEPPSATPE